MLRIVALVEIVLCWGRVVAGFYESAQTGGRAGKQWRYEAALSEDREPIQTDPYRWVRHPIYASLFGMLQATGCAWTWWPLFVAAVIAFLVGTEIRVRAEDGLLAERFQESFTAYRSRVRAYIPFIR
jgi:protein-S-isoprenylcysteine O-methyltransferase Ste14